ncbi:hypothetical protein TSOC_003938 [Tetrabaena socialis]|uniref:Uncharacterized protein n=1 Tax=Tetrabaena socialis TaxID=47790 RepID=A0A2J8AAB7_9CHLO|nr:hypothetical protein TSOC_003938 [Tetrabaena socialis]|eukprot:PNH09451.1 hypothetical protein TSOC_003938 [Tetrabaena socialis]
MAAITGADAGAVVDAENWKIRVRHEQEQAKSFQGSFGFLTDRTIPDHVNQPHARHSIKYFTSGGAYTLLQKKIPLVGRDAAKAVQQEQEYLATATTAGSRPTTALQATLFSHSRRMDYIGCGGAGG